MQLLNANLGLNIQESDIISAHRIGRVVNSTVGSDSASSAVPGGSHSRGPKPLPIIVQFSNKKLRNEALSHRKLLKGRGFSVTEQLTTARASLLRKCTELVGAGKLMGAWCHDGRILIKSLNQRSIVVSNERDLAIY
jgi:hypothetical protein